MTVGTIVTLKVACLGNEVGTKGVVFYDYGDGVQVIFANGEYDGFSKCSTMPNEKTETDFFLAQIGFCEDLANYSFQNVMTVSRDYKKGVFDKAIKS